MARPLKSEEKKKQFSRLKERDGMNCFWCGVSMYEPEPYIGKLPNRTATIDHIIPLSRGGTNHLDNLLLACNKCNHTRGDQMPPREFWKREFLR